ncbi:flagellar hook-associated protein FlgK [Pseudomonas sp. ATCC 13867]|uniref:flagellar hook-associated protein FlgK n=1 Tax=Pseudomonas sp. ATCC 13867 TaxID=1294143 RepID=UPI0002C4DCF2|nr:flagellar hook-associated protein FlgK [Pseudomonas sp. ATCC 13867]AGI23637.1 flagellar hook-associated protein FlgK [Pseudomonas sp. ATCC 13867]RFQ27739.1 flagellar hook-associated protein FlgK [Pseudomonas sp. ATCC 13867]
MSDLLSIGLSGIRSNQTSLGVTGHNIANVNTPGYSRQQSVQQTGIPQFNGAGYIGSGSQVVDVRRLASDFLFSQVRTATSQANELNAFQGQIEQLDALLSDTTTGISPALQKFFAALQTAAANPSATEGREALLAEAQGLSKSFNTLYDQLDKQNSLINQQLDSLANQVNSLASSVASYNDAIAKAKAAGGQPNDLIDAREETIRKLSELIGVQAVPQDDNTINLFIGTGQPLVVGTTTSTLQVVPGIDDPTRFQVQLASGSAVQTITTQISGGQMGGLLAYRDTALDASYNKLGQIALTFADAVNKQLGQGLDLSGNAGSKLFGDINASDIARLRVLAQSSNTGTVDAQLQITDTSKLGASDYRLEYDGAKFTARRLSDNAPIEVKVSGTGPYTLSFADQAGVGQGFEVTLNALPPAGDGFTLQPTRRGAADIETVLTKGDQLAFAGTARSEATTNNRGTGTIGQPTLTGGPSPVVVDDLQRLFGGGLSLQLDAGGTQLNGTLPPGASLSYVSPDSAGLTSGQTNTLRLDYTDPNTGNQYSYEFTLSGAPQAGDTFTLGMNSKGISDNSNALALSGLQSKASVGGTGSTGASFNDAYGGLVERIGTLTAQVRNNADASITVLKQAQDNRDSLSGVNLDEEAANLIQFQQYYSASAQVIQVARSLFDTLIGAFR